MGDKKIINLINRIGFSCDKHGMYIMKYDTHVLIFSITIYHATTTIYTLYDNSLSTFNNISFIENNTNVCFEKLNELFKVEIRKSKILKLLKTDTI